MAGSVPTITESSGTGQVAGLSSYMSRSRQRNGRAGLRDRSAPRRGGQRSDPFGQEAGTTQITAVVLSPSAFDP